MCYVEEKREENSTYSARKTLDSNDQNQVADQRFSLKNNGLLGVFCVAGSGFSFGKRENAFFRVETATAKREKWRENHGRVVLI